MYAYGTYGQTAAAGTSTVASLVGTGLTAALAIYQIDAQRRADKQAEHQRERDAAAAREHELALARERNRMQYDTTVAATTGLSDITPHEGRLPVGRKTNWMMLGGLGLAALVVVGGGAAVLRRKKR